MSEPQQTLTIQQALDLAVQHHTAGDLNQAENIYQQILQNDPSQPIALHLLGVIAHQEGRNDVAVDLINKALNLKPDLPDAHYNRGNALTGLGRLEEALTNYRKAIDLKPNHAEAHNNLGNTLRDLGKLDKSAVCYRKAVSIKPDYVEACNNLGLTLWRLGNPEDAVTNFERALALRPDFADAYNNLGNALRDLGKLEGAVASYRKALGNQYDFAHAHNNLGNALRDLGRLEEAITSYQKALALKPDLPEAHSNLGVSLQALGKTEEAVASYRKAIDLKPDYAEAYNNLGVSLQAIGKLEEGARSYRRALAMQPHLPDALSNLGKVLAEQGKYREEVVALQDSFVGRTSIQPTGDKDLASGTTGIFLELTNKCNFHCKFCPSDSQKRALGFMDLELAKRAYEEIAKKKLAPRVLLHLMGEPTLHPKLIDILNFGASKNVKTDLVTNGSTLVAKVVPQILDALYGTLVASHMTPTKETYHFRGKVGLSWDRYIGNIRLLVREYMKRLANGENIRNEIDLRIMVTKDTASNVGIIESKEQARAIYTEWVDFVSQIEREMGMTAFKREEPIADDLLRENLYASTKHRLQQGIVLSFWKAFTFANTRVSEDYDLQKSADTIFCPHPFKDVGVLWNGDVTLCCLDHDGQLKVGNIQDTSIEDVIQGEGAENLRASMLGGRPLPLVCQTCQARPVKRGENVTGNIAEPGNSHSSVGRSN